MYLQRLRCAASFETAQHALRECHFAHAVWFASPLGVGRGDIRGAFMKDWLHSIVESKGVDFDVVLKLLWTLWTERNKLVWEGKGIKLLFRVSIYFSILLSHRRQPIYIHTQSLYYKEY
ncbi:hypothetical protein ACFX2C_006517 [Malus domestica]